jgi:hypothetical protein
MTAATSETARHAYEQVVAKQNSARRISGTQFVRWERWLALALSVGLLMPCLWLPHIQASTFPATHTVAMRRAIRFDSTDPHTGLTCIIGIWRYPGWPVECT